MLALGWQGSAPCLVRGTPSGRCYYHYVVDVTAKSDKNQVTYTTSQSKHSVNSGLGQRHASPLHTAMEPVQGQDGHGKCTCVDTGQDENTTEFSFQTEVKSWFKTLRGKRLEQVLMFKVPHPDNRAYTKTILAGFLLPSPVVPSALWVGPAWLMLAETQSNLTFQQKKGWGSFLGHMSPQNTLPTDTPGLSLP